MLYQHVPGEGVEEWNLLSTHNHKNGCDISITNLSKNTNSTVSCVLSATISNPSLQATGCVYDYYSSVMVTVFVLVYRCVQDTRHYCSLFLRSNDDAQVVETLIIPSEEATVFILDGPTVQIYSPLVGDIHKEFIPNIYHIYITGWDLGEPVRTKSTTMQYSCVLDTRIAHKNSLKIITVLVNEQEKNREKQEGAWAALLDKSCFLPFFLDTCHSPSHIECLEKMQDGTKAFHSLSSTKENDGSMESYPFVIPNCFANIVCCASLGTVHHYFGTVISQLLCFKGAELMGAVAISSVPLQIFPIFIDQELLLVRQKSKLSVFSSTLELIRELDIEVQQIIVADFEENGTTEVCLIVNGVLQYWKSYSDICVGMEEQTADTSESIVSLLHLLQGRILTGINEEKEENEERKRKLGLLDASLSLLQQLALPLSKQKHEERDKLDPFKGIPMVHIGGVRDKNEETHSQDISMQDLDITVVTSILDYHHIPQTGEWIFGLQITNQTKAPVRLHSVNTVLSDCENAVAYGWKVKTTIPSCDILVETERSVSFCVLVEFHFAVPCDRDIPLTLSYIFTSNTEMSCNGRLVASCSNEVVIPLERQLIAPPGAFQLSEYSYFPVQEDFLLVSSKISLSDISSFISSLFSCTISYDNTTNVYLSSDHLQLKFTVDSSRRIAIITIGSLREDSLRKAVKILKLKLPEDIVIIPNVMQSRSVTLLANIVDAIQEEMNFIEQWIHEVRTRENEDIVSQMESVWSNRVKLLFLQIQSDKYCQELMLGTLCDQCLHLLSDLK